LLYTPLPMLADHCGTMSLGTAPVKPCEVV
jgi:hypothetical protein